MDKYNVEIEIELSGKKYKKKVEVDADCGAEASLIAVKDFLDEKFNYTEDGCEEEKK